MDNIWVKKSCEVRGHWPM